MRLILALFFIQLFLFAKASAQTPEVDFEATCPKGSDYFESDILKNKLEVRDPLDAEQRAKVAKDECRLRSAKVATIARQFVNHPDAQVISVAFIPPMNLLKNRVLLIAISTHLPFIGIPGLGMRRNKIYVIFLNPLSE